MPKKKPEPTPPPKREVGKPTKYRPEYCEMLIEHRAKGYSFKAFAGLVRVERPTLYNWCEQFPEFAQAKEIAYGAGLLFWEDLGITNIINTNESTANVGSKSTSLNSTVFSLMTRSMFPEEFKERQPDEVPKFNINVSSLTDEELKAELQKAIDSLGVK